MSCGNVRASFEEGLDVFVRPVWPTIHWAAVFCVVLDQRRRRVLHRQGLRVYKLCGLTYRVTTFGVGGNVRIVGEGFPDRCLLGLWGERVWVRSVKFLLIVSLCLT